MKKILGTTFLLMLVCLLFAAAAHADTLITVTGSAAVNVPSDTAVISLGVSMHDRDVQAAQSAVNERVASIRGALTAAGIPAGHVTTDSINVYGIYDYSGDTERISAYNASVRLAVRVTDMDSIGQVIDLAFGAGANMLDGISFSAADCGSARETALRQAVLDARAQADILADSMGMKIVATEQAVQNGSSLYGYEAERYAAKGAANDTVVEAAGVTVTASVVVTYRAE